MITEKQFKIFIEKLMGEIDNAQENCGNLDWISKYQALDNIDKLSKELLNHRPQSKVVQGGASKHSQRALITEDTFSKTYLANQICSCGHAYNWHKDGEECFVRKKSFNKIGKRIDCQCKKFKPKEQKGCGRLEFSNRKYHRCVEGDLCLACSGDEE